jgi:hypothetical protein
MIGLIVLGVLVLLGLGAGLAQWRVKRIQGNPNFAPTDHVELDRFGGGSVGGGVGGVGRGAGGVIIPVEHRHEEDPPGFQMGD